MSAGSVSLAAEAWVSKVVALTLVQPVRRREVARIPRLTLSPEVDIKPVG
jgi:hypothetical protein